MLLLDRNDLDAGRFEALVEEGRAMLAGGEPGKAAEVLRTALALWHGPAFGELAAEAYLRSEATRLEELRAVAMEEWAQTQLEVGAHLGLCAELESSVANYSYRERLWAQWMLALYRSGRQADALRAYQRLRRLLGDDLGIEPSEELRILEEDILLHKPHLQWAAPQPAVVGSADLVEADPRPDRLRSAIGARSHDLAASSSFVGRETEMSDLISLLETAPDFGRLVTVTGAGGMGKTRLALQAASGVSPQYAGGAWFIELAPVDRSEAVADVVLQALGGRRQTGQSSLSALGAFGEGRRMLVLLDNCEHVVAAAAQCAEAIAASGGNLVLATSPEPLGLPGERPPP